MCGLLAMYIAQLKEAPTESHKNTVHDGTSKAVVDLKQKMPRNFAPDEAAEVLALSCDCVARKL